MTRQRSEIATTYADALARVFEKNERIERSFDLVQSLYEILVSHPRLRKLLEAPHIQSSRKQDLVTTVLEPRIAKTLTHFLRVLIRRGRSFYLMEILEAYRNAAESQLGHLCGLARVATPISAAEQKRLMEILSQRMGTKVFLEFVVDPRLLGGVRIEVGDYLFDASLKGRLQALEKQLSH